jgi:hypothetical protein
MEKFHQFTFEFIEEYWMMHDEAIYVIENEFKYINCMIAIDMNSVFLKSGTRFKI